jgi:hypothetical protein
MKMRNLLRLVPAALLGVGAAVLVSCGSSGKGLIPLANAGPLQSDFQAVLEAAQEGNGNCAATEAQIRKTERDLAALPSSVDGGLRGRLAEGVTNLSARARVLCAQPLTQTTTTTTETTTATTPPATTTSTQPTATTTAPTATTPRTGTPSGEEGGTQAPGEEGAGQEAEGDGGEGRGNGLGKGEGGGRGNGQGGVESEEDGSGEVSGGAGGGR